MPESKKGREIIMLTKTIYALSTTLVLAASPALAVDHDARSAFAIPDRVTSTQATQAYASAQRNPVVRNGQRIVRPFSQAERLWFDTAQGYEDRF
jgi:hypothetical protein